MAGIYQVISDWFPHVTCAGKIDEAVSSLGSSGTAHVTGMQIMQTKPTDFADLFSKFVTFIHTKGFVWDGNGRGGSGYPFLDGTLKSGECAMYAKGFFILAFAPPPYGLGIPKHELEFVPYPGPAKKGFVSTHPASGVMTLKPNVSGQDLYLWSSHKVVRYRNILYDVMYNTTYSKETDMVAYNIVEDSREGLTSYSKAEAMAPGITAGTYWFRCEGDKPYDGPLTSK